MSNSIKQRRNKNVSGLQRLKRDYIRIMKDPIPYITAHPLPWNIFEWHFVIKGPEKTFFENGIYHGYLVFTEQFPFNPPKIYMLTPNGRFEISKKLCLSMSDFHPETWNPAWSVSTILTGLLSFMVEDEPTYGSISTTGDEKKKLAKASLQYNLKNEIFCFLFPEYEKEICSRLSKEEKNIETDKILSNNSKRSQENICINIFLCFFLVIVLLFAIFLVKYMISLINGKDNI